MTSPDSFSRTVMDVPNASEDQDENEEDIIPRQLTEPVLLNFLENFLSGALAPTITSEELGPNEKTTLAYVPMHKVVASNFNTLSGSII